MAPENYDETRCGCVGRSLHERGVVPPCNQLTGTKSNDTLGTLRISVEEVFDIEVGYALCHVYGGFL